MRIAIASDLHLEFWSNTEYVKDQQKKRFKNPGDADVLVLAGDTAEIINYDKFIWFFQYISEQYDHVIMVAGNHEFYHGSIDDVKNLKKFFKKNIPNNNIHYLDDSQVKLGDVRFIGSTLWTSIDNENPRIINQHAFMMNDYRYIWYIDTILRPKHTVWFHKKSLGYLSRAIKRYRNKNEKIVLVTHHAPSLGSIHEQYTNKKEDYEFSFMYCSDLLESGKLPKVDLAIHGHVHTPFDYIVNGTRVVCNPFGYPGQRTSRHDCILDDFSLTVLKV
jgi:predicted phosphodiesterase